MLWWKEDADSGEAYYTNVIKGFKSHLKGFKRPMEIDPKASLWGDNKLALFNGVQQGGLGNCWFMAAAGAIAEYPARVKRMFVNQDFTNSGIFQLKFYFKGQKTIVNIDDKLAVNKHNKPMFA